MVRRLPNLNAVKAFDAAARHQSFSRAADELSVTHAAISRHVRALEEELGVRLFDRKHRQVLLTGAGERYAATVEQALRSIAMDTLDLRSKETTRVVLEVETDLATLWLLPLLSQFPFETSGIELDIRAQAGTTRTIQADADLAITWGFLQTPGYEVQPLLGYTAFPVASPGWLEERKGCRKLADFLPCMLLHDRGTYWWNAMFEAEGIGPEPDCGNLFFNRTDLSLEAAARGDGLAVGDDLVSADMLKTGRLVCVPGSVLPGTTQYYLVTPRRRELRPALRLVADWILEAAEQHKTWAATLKPATST